MADSKALTAEERAAAVALVEAIVGFEHQHSPNNPFGQNTLAELREDGVWRAWDMKAPYSTEACAFIAAAPDLLRRYEATLVALEAAQTPPSDDVLAGLRERWEACRTAVNDSGRVDEAYYLAAHEGDAAAEYISALERDKAAAHSPAPSAVGGE